MSPIRYILTCIDTFSRYITIVPLRDKTAQHVADALTERIICSFGVPRKVINDNDNSLLGAAMKIVYERWGILGRETTGYQPQANPVERWHRWLHHQMTILRHQFGDNYWEYLPATAFSYNCSVNEVTGYSPFELVYQRLPTIPADLAVELQVPTPLNHREYTINAAVRMKAAFRHVRASQTYAAEKNRDRRLRSAKTIAFGKNDLVLK